MRNSGNAAAKTLKQAPPTVVETNEPDGTVRLVIRWPDGEETNECTLTPTGHQKSFTA